MRTALTMYNNMKKRGYEPRLSKEICLTIFERMVSVLEPDEEVVFPFLAQYDGKWQSCAITKGRVIIVTDVRGVFKPKIYSSSFDLQQLVKIATDDPKSKTTSLHFHVESGNIYTVEIENDIAGSLPRAIYETLTVPNNKNKGNVSISKEIERFKKLFDSGAITQAEFEQAKIKLL